MCYYTYIKERPTSRNGAIERYIQHAKAGVWHSWVIWRSWYCLCKAFGTARCFIMSKGTTAASTIHVDIPSARNGAGGCGLGAGCLVVRS